MTRSTKTPDPLLGELFTVRPSGKATELLIRFEATGEAWIDFGYGVLEFHQ